jgi:acetyltransferase-like isoleucine patch superfamily enzyme
LTFCHKRRERLLTLLKDHRPYYIKKAYLNFQKRYVRHFLRPQFESLGRGFTFMKPWHVELFGAPIILGRCATVIATPDRKVRLSVWPKRGGKGAIRIGHFCILCPGVRIGSADGVEVGDNCMFASNAYVTDSDWHDIYNRIAIGRTAPVKIEDNVWVGDSAIVCKGVTIGTNSIIGAGAVVVDDVPANVIAAGNPARIVKHLDAGEQMITREDWFDQAGKLSRELEEWDRAALHGNTLRHWLRHILRPRPGE